LVEDAGLFIEALNGFPGAYSSFAYKTLGCKGILKLLEDIPPPRWAYFKSCVGYYDGHGRITVVEGVCRGKISLDERGSRGFGFDPIFIPEGSNNRTFAEMEVLEKNEYSHRAKALRELFQHFKF